MEGGEKEDRAVSLRQRKAFQERGIEKIISLFGSFWGKWAISKN